MTATNHGLFGAGLAVVFSSHPVVAIVVAPFSHFLLDAFPHYTDHSIDVKSKKFFTHILIPDAILAVVSTLILAVIWSEIWWLIILCSFLAASPDLMWIYYEYVNPKLKIVHKIPRFHHWIQWWTKPSGIIIEIAWYVVLFSALVYFGVAQ